ncbi:MAG: glycerophosphoryl diester phosphodiesterase, partial [Frankiaceae bacterium]|nr:glycerophosphoryl diester phosphodiesterase [Frankiaceae bacterium]
TRSHDPVNVECSRQEVASGGEDAAMTQISRGVAIAGAVVATVIGAVVPASAHAARTSVLPSTLVVSAHRGGSAYAPEDTMYAYRNAVRIGADQMETDSWLTADGVLVLIHDSTLDRTTSCTGSVSSYTFARLRKCDAGWWWTPGQSTTSPDPKAQHPLRGLGIRVPAARELFGYIKSLGRSDRHTINIEIKDENFVKPTQALVSLIEASGLKNRTIVQSFYPPALDYVKTLDSTISTALLTEGSTSPYLAYSLAGDHQWISPGSTDVDLSTTTVSAAHAAGKKVIPWTPDTKSDLTAAGLKGVDGLITNYPACLLALEGRRPPARLLPAASIAAGSDPVPLCAA